MPFRSICMLQYCNWPPPGPCFDRTSNWWSILSRAHICSHHSPQRCTYMNTHCHKYDLKYVHNTAEWLCPFQELSMHGFIWTGVKLHNTVAYALVLRCHIWPHLQLMISALSSNCLRMAWYTGIYSTFSHPLECTPRSAIHWNLLHIQPSTGLLPDIILLTIVHNQLTYNIQINLYTKT